MNDDLRVPVVRVAVQLLCADGTRREGSVFRPPGEGVETLLESSDAFVPVDEGGKIVFHARDALAVASVPRPPARGDEHDDGLPRRTRAVTVKLRNGLTLAGEILYVAHGRTRTADLLNQPGATLVLRNGEQLHYVVKAHVAFVEEAAAP